MWRCPAQDCVNCSHLTITGSASTRNRPAHLIRTFFLFFLQKERKQNYHLTPCWWESSRSCVRAPRRVSQFVWSERWSVSQTDGQDEKETAEDGDGLRVYTLICFQAAVTELRPAAAVAVYDTHGSLTRILCRCACAHLCGDYGRRWHD